jgi:hypothetical protein
VTYANRIELTAVMHENAVQNIKTVYYDPADYTLSEESERVFSPNAFDGTSYLNGDFQFVTSHPSETKTVCVTDAEGNVCGNMEFFVTVDAQSVALPHGVLSVTEQDAYGNETNYTVLRDLHAPVLTVRDASGTETILSEDGDYSASGSLEICEMCDDLDGYAVLRITRPDGESVYYYQQEYVGIVFDTVGTYLLSAYDRNGNVLSVTVSVA